MKREMKKYGLPETEFYEERDSFKVVFRNNNVVHHGQQIVVQTGQVSEQVSEQVLEYRKRTVEFCITPKSARQIREYLKMKSRNYVNDNVIKPLIAQGIIEYTNKEYLSASNQKYITVNNQSKKEN